MAAVASGPSPRLLILGVFFYISIIITIMAPSASGDVSCGGVKTALAPCVSFLKRGTPPLPSAGSRCCAGVKQLSSAASSSREARQAICRCIEASAATIKPLPSAISHLPSACAIAFPYSFSLTQDCSKLP